VLAGFLFKPGRRHNRTRRPTSVAPSERPFWEPNPGSKPWAVLFGHFVANRVHTPPDSWLLAPFLELLQLLELLEESSIQNLGIHMNAGDAWNAKFQIAFQLGHHLMRFPERRLSGEFSFERDYQSLIGH
jgi:hypothetical protein